jgi:hypothetical protein
VLQECKDSDSGTIGQTGAVVKNVQNVLIFLKKVLSLQPRKKAAYIFK